MANAADRLFEQVLSQLPDPPEAPESPAADSSDADGYDQIDYPAEGDESELRPLGDLETSDRVGDILTGGMTVPQPSEEDKEIIEGGIRERGFEAIAFYKSRRFLDKAPFPGKWGIFYINEGLIYLGWQIFQAYPGYRDPRVLARDFLRKHEHFHFRADLRTLMFEATLGKHLYIRARHNFRGKRTAFVEEAMANRQAYDWAKRPAIGLEEFAHDFMKLQPGAYARFLEPINDLAGEWAANVVDGLGPRCLPRHDLAPWVLDTPLLYMRPSLCPEYVVFPQALSNWIDPAYIPPPVKVVNDDEKLIKILERKLPHLKQAWANTKRKLVEDRTLYGLNFKPWRKDGKDTYSVKVDDGNRAHLRHQGNGNWLAYIIGNHKELGHG